MGVAYSPREMEVYERAKQLLEAGQLKSSFKLYSEFISHQKGSTDSSCLAELSDAYNSRGHIRYLWVEFDEAVEDYTEAISLDPKFAVAYYNRGQIHYRLGKIMQHNSYCTDEFTVKC